MERGGRDPWGKESGLMVLAFYVLTCGFLLNVGVQVSYRCWQANSYLFLVLNCTTYTASTENECTVADQPCL